MATKEDILEQVVGEYLIHKGYFVRHNLKFLPRKDHPDFDSKFDSNHSDIDVIGYHPLIEDKRKVIVVSCKSWQNGFSPASELDAILKNKKLRGREAWKAFRELTVSKWSEAFLKAIKDTTGTDRFTYVIAVTKLSGDKAVWECHEPFRQAIGGSPVTILTLREMVTEIQSELTTTMAATEIGRILQLFAAADMKVRDE